jgi:hypothetical protein
MTDRPYTDTDLRTLAAHLHAGAARNADDRIRPSVQRQWGTELDLDQIDEACDEMTGLLDSAANVSRWAVNLGADGLEPTEHVIDLDNPDGPFVRIHLAIHPDMPEADRLRLHAGLKQAITDAL